MRAGFLEAEGRPKRLRDLITVSIISFISVFKALLYIKGIEIPHNRKEIINTIANIYAIDPDIFLQCIDIKEGTDHIAISDIRTIFDSYLKEIGKLSKIVDCLEMK